MGWRKIQCGSGLRAVEINDCSTVLCNKIYLHGKLDEYGDLTDIIQFTEALKKERKKGLEIALTCYSNSILGQV